MAVGVTVDDWPSFSSVTSFCQKRREKRKNFSFRTKKTFERTFSCFFFFFDSRLDDRRSLKLPPIGFDTCQENSCVDIWRWTVFSLDKPSVIWRFVKQIDLHVDLFPRTTDPTTAFRPSPTFVPLQTTTVRKNFLLPHPSTDHRSDELRKCKNLFRSATFSCPVVIFPSAREWRPTTSPYWRPECISSSLYLRRLGNRISSRHKIPKAKRKMKMFGSINASSEIYLVRFADFEQIQTRGIPFVDQIENFGTIFRQAVHGHVISRNKRDESREEKRREERGKNENIVVALCCASFLDMESSTDVTRRTKTNLFFLFLFVISSSNETMTEAMNKSVVFVSVRIKCAEQRSLQSPRRAIGDFYSFFSHRRHSNHVEPRLDYQNVKKSHLFVIVMAKRSILGRNSFGNRRDSFPRWVSDEPSTSVAPRWGNTNCDWLTVEFAFAFVETIEACLMKMLSTPNKTLTVSVALRRMWTIRVNHRL